MTQGVDLGTELREAKVGSVARASKDSILIKNDIDKLLFLRCPGCNALMPILQWRWEGYNGQRSEMLLIDADTSRCSMSCVHAGAGHAEESQEPAYSGPERRAPNSPMRGVRREAETRHLQFRVVSDAGPMSRADYATTDDYIAARKRQIEIDAAIELEHRKADIEFRIRAELQSAGAAA